MGGLAWGLAFATAFSAFVLLMALLRGSTVYEGLGGLTTWRVIAYYFAAGVMGGTVFGLLRPIQHRYLGKFVTAYLILFLVYGGGTAMMLPFLNKREGGPIPLSVLLAAWAVFCLLLAPVYVRITRGWSEW